MINLHVVGRDEGVGGREGGRGREGRGEKRKLLSIPNSILQLSLQT